MYDVFRAGVEPGGLTMDYEIKILICYILRSLGHPMPISALIEVFVSEGIGNYFEAASAASGLVKSGHIEILPPVHPSLINAIRSPILGATLPRHSKRHSPFRSGKKRLLPHEIIF